MDIDFTQLQLAGQVLERQRGHADAIGTHLERYARLDAGDLGLILQLVQPITDAMVDAGIKATEFSSRAFNEGTERMQQSVTAYVDAERTAHAATAQVIGMLGGDAAPYAPPGAPTLGAPQTAAPSRYGEPDGNLFNQAYGDGSSAAEWASETRDDVTGRAKDARSGSRTVTEAVDVRSFLPTPQGDDPEIESIRWKAGPVFGSVDWVFEKLVGYSLLEEVTKPFSGDWERMRDAQIAWTHTGDAMTAIGRNSMGLLPPMASWTGKGSEAFAGAAAVISQAHTGAAGPAATIASALKVLIMLCKKAVAKILEKLEVLSEKLLRIAAKASIPVVGWIAAVADAGLTVHELIKDAQWAYKWINRIYDLASGMVSSISGIVDNAMRMADLYEGLARGAMARA